MKWDVARPQDVQGFRLKSGTSGWSDLGKAYDVEDLKQIFSNDCKKDVWVEIELVTTPDIHMETLLWETLLF